MRGVSNGAKTDETKNVLGIGPKSANPKGRCCRAPPPPPTTFNLFIHPLLCDSVWLIWFALERGSNPMNLFQLVWSALDGCHGAVTLSNAGVISTPHRQEGGETSHGKLPRNGVHHWRGTHGGPEPLAEC